MNQRNQDGSVGPPNGPQANAMPMVPIPMASSSGGTDYADYKDFYKQQQNQSESDQNQNSNTQVPRKEGHENPTFEKDIGLSKNSVKQSEKVDIRFDGQNAPQQVANNNEKVANNSQMRNLQQQQIDQNVPNFRDSSSGVDNVAVVDQMNPNAQLNQQKEAQNEVQTTKNQPIQNQHQQQQQQLQQQQLSQQMVQQQEDFEEDNLVGVIKIKDGLFICDEYGAQDLEFIISNKVQRIVNTAGMQLNNHWDSINVQYLTLNWQDDEKQVLFDEAEKIPDEIFNFMNEGMENHESVLVKSEKAQNRACFVIAAFIMRKYRWSMLKTLEFLNSRRQDLEMRPAFIRQLQMYENKLFKRGAGPKTQRWTEIFDGSDPIRNEELILRNTYLNSQQGPWAEFSKVPSVAEAQKTIQQDRGNLLKWRDNLTVPFYQSSTGNGTSNNQKSPLAFMCGGAMLGASIKSNNSMTKGQNLSITQEYPLENDLLHKSNPLKQQNHYIYQKDTIQMRRNIAPILRKKSKSTSASKIIQNNKENLVEQQQQPSTANNRSSSSKSGISNMIVANTKVRPQSQQNAQERIVGSHKSMFIEANNQNQQVQQVQNTNPGQPVKPSHSAFTNNYIGDMAQSKQQRDLAPTNTRTQKTQQNNQAPASQSGPHQVRSSSTKVRPANSSNDKQYSNSSANAVKKSSNDKVSQSYSNSHQREKDEQINQQKLAKLSQQNISQPRRREPTSRVAPKNQVSQAPINHSDIKNTSQNDTSILSSTGANHGGGNASFSHGAHPNQIVQQHSGSSNNANNSQLLPNKKQTSDNSQASKNSSANRVSSGRTAYTNQITTGGIGSFQSSMGGHHPVHPSKKQQLRYQQQLNGRGYSPSYNNLVGKDGKEQQPKHPSGQNANHPNYSNYSHGPGQVGNDRQQKASKFSSQSNQGHHGNQHQGHTNSSRGQKQGSSHYQNSQNTHQAGSQKKISSSTVNQNSSSSRPGSAPKHVNTQNQGEVNHKINQNITTGSGKGSSANYTGSSSRQQQSGYSQNSKDQGHYGGATKHSRPSSGYGGNPGPGYQGSSKSQGVPSDQPHHMMSNSQHPQQHVQRGPGIQQRLGQNGMNNHQHLGNNNSLVIRNSSSQQAISGNKNTSTPHNNLNQNQVPYQNQDDANNHQQINSKSILSSFRNGPVKIMGTQNGSSQQQITNQIQNQDDSSGNKVQQHQIQSMNSFNRMGQINYNQHGQPQQQQSNQPIQNGRAPKSSFQSNVSNSSGMAVIQQHEQQKISSGSTRMSSSQQRTISGGGMGSRPGSAPNNKRPPSPGQQNGQTNNTGSNAMNESSNRNTTQGYFQQNSQNAVQQNQRQSYSNGQTGQHRVKYPKALIEQNQRSSTGGRMQPVPAKQMMQASQAQQVNPNNHKFSHTGYQLGNRPGSQGSGQGLGSSRGAGSSSGIMSHQLNGQGSITPSAQANPNMFQNSNTFNQSQQMQNQARYKQMQQPHHFGPSMSSMNQQSSQMHQQKGQANQGFGHKHIISGV